MSEFNEGDLVEAVKGETVIRGRVTGTNLSSGWIIINNAGSVILLDAWTLSVIEKAAPKLPTEPGSVLRGTGPNASILMRRYPVNGHEPEGPWVSVGDVTYSDDEAVRFFHGQFTPLESPPVTAKKVLDAVIAQTTIHCNACAEHLASIAATFGVTE